MRSSVRAVTTSEMHGLVLPTCPLVLQVGLVLLCRLLSWLHLASVVAPGSPNCVRFVLIMGQAQSGKASLFTQLVAAPAELAAQLGGGAAYGAESTAGEGKKVRDRSVNVARMGDVLL